jgi:hypothetical protein
MIYAPHPSLLTRLACGTGVVFQQPASGTTSLLMKVNSGKVAVEAYDRMGKKIDDIPNEKSSPALRDALQNTFQHEISPDHDGVIAII